MQFQYPVAEDCLNFNLARPSQNSSTTNSSSELLPVMVWIFGGGFSGGAIANPQNNQSWIVQTSQEIGKPVIVITLNTRLSAWGYMNSEEAIRQGVANLGLRDAWKFLEWLHGKIIIYALILLEGLLDEQRNRLTLMFMKENIAGFGGDPDRITVFGQSSGGLTVEMLAMAYSGQHRMFNNGITSSITLFSPFWGTIAASQAKYNSLLSATNCTYANDGLECLRECE